MFPRLNIRNKHYNIFIPMKKILMRCMAVLAAYAGISMTLSAQMTPQPLPLDSAVVYGVLDNGLTYYIRHNEKPKGQADFYIAQKVGSILEDDSQRGLAHFLEHMCFNGTTNFPDKGIINWLESKGVKFGVNLNAYTSIDETVYNISNVPVSSKAVQDSCLLILHDWACDLTLAPEEIDAERAVIHNEWSQSMVGEMRLYEKLLPTIYPDNKYGERLPIGTMDVVLNFPHQALIDYYHKWYRPDQQGIIVVGDIDPQYIESKIKEMFGGIKMPENPAPREYVSVEDTPGTIYAMGSDPEVKAPNVALMFKSPGLDLPREQCNTNFYFFLNYPKVMITMMMNNRLSDIAATPEAEFANARVYFGNFFLSKTMPAMTLDVDPKGNDMLPAFTQAYRELLRASKGGFTIGEYERAKSEFLSRIERAYEGRNDVQNESYVKEYVELFLNNNPAPGIEIEKQFYDQLAAAFPVEQINMVLPQVITDDNRVLLAIVPEKEGYTLPTEEQFAAAVESVDAEELEPYKDEMREDPLIAKLPKAGKIKSVKELKEWGAKEYTLSNGVKVVVKPTDFKANEIIFEAMATGNAGSTLDQSKAASIKYAPYAAMNVALNDYSNSDLRKYLQGKQASVAFSFDDYTRQFEGNATPKDLSTLMEMIYSYFTGFGLREDEFNAGRDGLIAQLANQENVPNFIFSKDLMASLYSAPSKQMISVDDLKAADRQAIVDMVRNMTVNAADYTFYFVGNIDEATFEPLMLQYLATLPANAKKASKGFTHNPAFEVAAGSKTDTYNAAMQTPQTFVFIGMFAKMPYTQKNKLLASIAAQVASKRLLNKVREEMGAVYSISANGDMSRTDELNVIFQSAFPTNKVEMKDETLKAIKDIFTAVGEKVEEDELKPVIEYMLKNDAEDLKSNSAWAGSMSATGLNGVNIFLGKEEVLKSITTKDVEDFMRAVIAQDNYRVIVLDPEGVAEEASK